MSPWLRKGGREQSDISAEDVLCINVCLVAQLLIKNELLKETSIREDSSVPCVGQFESNLG